MTTGALLALAETKQREVIYAHSDSAFSVELDSGCYIAMPSKLSSHSEKEMLAHELGHCEYGGFYNRYSQFDIREKAERRADKWAFSRLLPLGELRAAYRRGVRDLWEIAELFDVSCEYAERALRYYQTLGLCGSF